MSNTPQQPADGWQSPQQPPVYRPNEQPPEEPPPWSPESQRMSGMSQQQPGPGPVEADGTVKYVGGPGQPSPPPFGPPPGVPISPFDQPSQPPQQMSPQMPQQMPAADPFGGGGGVPVSGMPVSGMPPVSSIPASGMPVSGPAGQYGQQPPYGQPPFGGGQFGPQGGQLVPVSGGGGGAQPWGAPDTIKRKKKGGKGPMWLLIVGVVVIAIALGVGGFFLFSPGGDPSDEQTGTIESNSQEAETSAEASADPSATGEASASPSAEATSEAPAETPAATTVLANEGSGLSILVPEGSAEATSPPAVFTDVTGSTLAGGPTVYFGTLDSAAIGAGEDVNVEALGANLQNLAAEWAGGAAESPSGGQYRVDARSAYFNTFTVGGNTVMTAVVQNGGAYVGFVGLATPEQVEALEAARASISFGP
ncbi:hypothetical protein [Glycomyces terrestris]|uniref:Uncharacterized protein n=1 Tax=Glycomyces terrestris TaxID=2493553 RepID=A0A426V083_9ACTN|nr:hypothetical protein [Glycomyces terrestris]RRS00288.1 hypothetical protein EIW28_06795 [Glycomyces terrestris]